MPVDWQVAKPTRQCAASGRDLEEGEIYYSALKEEGEEFMRLDYSADAWPEMDKTPFFSFWRSRVPPENVKKRLVIDVEAFYTFFCNLDDPAEPHRILFRYLVALILTRKRVLRLDEIEKGPDGEALLLYDRRAEKQVAVACPEADVEQLTDAQEQLNQIFECQFDPDDMGI